jgi:hypothetical protein
MDPLFSLSSSLVLPFWLAMLLAPTWRWTERVMRSMLPVAVLAAIYSALIIPRLPDILPGLMQPRLHSIAALLGTPEGATIGWVHFLAFDLFVGRWAYLDSRERGISGWLMAPVLALTLLMGPLGWLSYLGLRWATSSRMPHKAKAKLSELLRVNRALTAVGVIMLATLLGTLVGLIADPTVITGAPAWLKPAKFAISTSIYAFTFVWLLSFIHGHRRLVSAIANLSAAALFIEVAIIILQVVRGTTSHFNYSTPLDAALFEAMAGFIVLLWLMALLAAILLIRQKLPDRPFAWSLRIGLVVALVGMAVAFLMPPIGAHSVGVADGGPGLPLVGWSTVGGDLRVPHFVGLHALQVLPFLGWWLSRHRRLGQRARTAVVGIAGLGYLGFVLLLTWQALRGQSLIAPDALTLTAVGGLIGALLIAIAGTLLSSASRADRERGSHPYTHMASKAAGPARS